MTGQWIARLRGPKFASGDSVRVVRFHTGQVMVERATVLVPVWLGRGTASIGGGKVIERAPGWCYYLSGDPVADGRPWGERALHPIPPAAHEPAHESFADIMHRLGRDVRETEPSS